MLRFEHVSLCRGERELLRHAEFAIAPGRVTAILGPNGAGKSSLLLAMAGLLPASGGHVLLQDRPVEELSRMEVAATIAWQGELPAAEFGLTVRQRLELAAGDGESLPRLQQAAARMEVGHLLDRDLARLSSGERQRVELAAIMLRDCPLWLLDEPTAHLDLKHQTLLLRMLRQEAAAGRAVVTVLHDLQQAMAVADEVILLDGKGGVETGEAGGLLTAERLSRLFQVELMSFAEGQLLLPDYRT
ncbi:MAG TPA: ABC transporter ATP-binding protein [Mariprofundaceae bacterium]|nr:ABC transporter ATP-binding protein [Mariprofundaceae bacterium]